MLDESEIDDEELEDDEEEDEEDYSNLDEDLEVEPFWDETENFDNLFDKE
jgi:hypothetical protein